MKNIKYMLIIVTLAIVQQVFAVPNRITSGMVAEFKRPLELSILNYYLDTGPHGRHGNIRGGRISSYGWWGPGANITGSKYVEVTNNSHLNFGTGSFTIAAWIKMSNTSSSIKTIVDNRGSNGRGYAFAVYQGDKLLVQLADQDGWRNYTSVNEVKLSKDRWHHVAVTVNRTSWPLSIRFWIDGRDVGYASPHNSMGNINNTDRPFYIGKNKDSSSWNYKDRLDELLIYNRALNVLEVAMIMSPGTPDYTPSYWNNSSRQYDNNCYNYSSNKATNTFAQPGHASGINLNWPNDMTCAAVSAAVVADGLQPISGYPQTQVSYKSAVALVVDPYYDYHFYRLDDDGKWSHKAGQTAARNRDNSGALITDPRDANRGGYTDFCGFYYLWSDITEGLGHENIN